MSRVARVDRCSMRPDARSTLRRWMRSSPTPICRLFLSDSPHAMDWPCIAPHCGVSKLDCACSPASGDTDIDRFQESALFPGTPVVIAHAQPRPALVVRRQSALRGVGAEDRDCRRHAAAGARVYAAKVPYRIVTGATVRTMFTPEAPRVSQLQLDMGDARAVGIRRAADGRQRTERLHIVDGGIADTRRTTERSAFVPALLAAQRRYRGSACR